MNAIERNVLIRHFNRYFEQDNGFILQTKNTNPRIDGLLCAPNEKYPYWKLATLGASDYKMPAPKDSLGSRNEYVMFIDAEEDLTKQENLDWYFRRLLEVAVTPVFQKTFLSCGNSIERPEEEGEEMVGVYLGVPQVIGDVGILRCKLNPFKTAACLQVILLNREEFDRLQEIGSKAFNDYLYPKEGPRHFLCQRHRTERF